MKLMFVIGLALLVLCLLQINIAQALTVSDPWTIEAATFNPAGVKYSGGITTGHEIKQVYIPSYAPVMIQTALEEFQH